MKEKKKKKIEKGKKNGTQNLRIIFLVYGCVDGEEMRIWKREFKVE